MDSDNSNDQGGNPSSAAADVMRPCPFCGSKRPEVRTTDHGGYEVQFVACPSCACEGPWKKREGNARKAWNRRALEQMDSETNEILKGRTTTTELSIHAGSHPEVVRTALDRLKGSDDRAHDVILALYRDLQIAKNRAHYLGKELLGDSEDAA